MDTETILANDALIRTFLDAGMVEAAQRIEKVTPCLSRELRERVRNA